MGCGVMWLTMVSTADDTGALYTYILMRQSMLARVGEDSRIH